VQRTRERLNRPTATKRRRRSKTDEKPRQPRLEEQLDLRTREMRELREQQRATSKVLQVISSSSGELKPVLESILENAVRLCEASFGNLPRVRLARFLYRVADTKQVAHIADITLKNPNEPIAKVAGARTLLIVSMLRERDLIGVIAIYRREVRPFSGRQIDLVKSFAAQAVIAIENARLFEGEQQRSRELSESLEQQTATSEVLQVIYFRGSQGH
jgi:GAF domain-containing protein